MRIRSSATRPARSGQAARKLTPYPERFDQAMSRILRAADVDHFVPGYD